ncbi:MAG: YwiC-like family protein [Thermoleophilia bacterium]|nr:YwiC-like family protein [Thermoleophilia bacterium]
MCQIAMRERSRLRDVVVPTEHGGWGFTLEPMLLGLLVAPGWASSALAGR